ncbi:cytochrome P450 [Micromonospora sp. ALFpr18c]|uniref:cytochrome P450 n=1 Tax=Micromonospora sp. ALFpr18c TaxID=1458665 RepID=UPI00124AF068|nr:cytochrome P450 [Micromonospora sp. ALFpr18c]KAB1942435.1 cytochrome P450 [Micromonospora sp. ALFpr18c]
MTEPSIPTRRDPYVAGLRRVLPALLRDPLGTLVGLADASPGQVVRLNLGTIRPYLVVEPAHVQHVLRDNAANYTRAGDSMMWKSVKKLGGDGILAEGPQWEASRRRLQPHFTAKRIDAVVDGLSQAISDAVDELNVPARTGEPVDAASEISRIICQAVIGVFFGNKIPVTDGVRIVTEQDTVATALRFRLLTPFLPDAVPMPGDRALRRAVQNIDDILLPLVRAERAHDDGGDDIVASLGRGRDEHGHKLDEQRVRDDLVSIFVTATETTYTVLTWLFPLLEQLPDVAERLYAEIDRVVGPGDVINREQLGELRYTRMVLDELVRAYPSGWLVPRTAIADDVIGGTRVKAGGTIVLSPYVTQRLARFWDRPAVFDPERFAPDAPRRAHRYAYYPFGGGAHQCIGQYFFQVEAPLIVATLLSRFRYRLCTPGMPSPRLAASLRPRERVPLLLTPHRQPALA